MTMPTTPTVVTMFLLHFVLRPAAMPRQMQTPPAESEASTRTHSTQPGHIDRSSPMFRSRALSGPDAALESLHELLSKDRVVHSVHDDGTIDHPGNGSHHGNPILRRCRCDGRFQ